MVRRCLLFSVVVVAAVAGRGNAGIVRAVAASSALGSLVPVDDTTTTTTTARGRGGRGLSASALAAAVVSAGATATGGIAAAAAAVVAARMVMVVMAMLFRCPLAALGSGDGRGRAGFVRGHVRRCDCDRDGRQQGNQKTKNPKGNKKQIEQERGARIGGVRGIHVAEIQEKRKEGVMQAPRA